jgi:hypothetical protein
MGLWLALALLIATVFAVWVVRARRSPAAGAAGDSVPMPLPMQVILAIYLPGLAIALLYVTLKLFTLDFPETALVLEVPAPATGTSTTATPNGTTTGKSDQAGQRPPDTTALRLVRAIPHATTGSAPTLLITLQGTRLDRLAKVRINQRDRPSIWLGDNLIQVMPQQEDLIGVGSLTADVVNPDGAVSNALVIQVARPRMLLRIFDRELPITREVQLLLLVVCAGALGSFVHALKSFSDFLGNRSLTESWFAWYMSRPFLGMALAFVFYAVLRGGFLTGTPADVRVVNPFGAVAVAALVGMFADKATQKLAEIFDALFRGEDARRDKLEQPVVPAIEGQPAAAKVGEAYAQELKAVGGAPPYQWTIAGAPAWLTLDSKTGKLTGTPAAADAGSAKVTVTVTDSKRATAAKVFDLAVKP